VHPEFRQQRGNVKFYGSFRDIEIGSDFLVRKTTQDAGKNFLFPARQRYLVVNGHPAEQSVSLLDKVLQKDVFGLDHNRVIFANFVPNQAMLGKQSGRLTSQETAVRSGLLVKMYCTRIFLIKEEDVAVRDRTGGKQLMRMFTSMDSFQVHPLKM
jgi:hypothetical protein